MGTHEFNLIGPPDGERARELWIQHAAGFILIQDVRNYALGRIPEDLTPHEKEIATKAVDDALYGLMQVIDGVSGALLGDGGMERVSLRTVVDYERVDESGVVIDSMSLDLIEGDGVCMGVHSWLDGDFGDYPIAVQKSRIQ